jgi:hypothetical protein
MPRVRSTPQLHALLSQPGSALKMLEEMCRRLRHQRLTARLSVAFGGGDEFAASRSSYRW